MKKRMIACLLGCALLAGASGAYALSGTEVAVLKVGKADAIIVKNATHTVLIDTGEDEDAEEILEFLASRKIEAVDVMIVTHYDKDHVGGADGVLRGIAVREIYDANYEADSEDYAEYVVAIADRGVPRHRVTADTPLQLGELTLTLLPSGIVDGDDNEHSLVVSAKDAWHSFFFAADATEARIEELLAAGLGPHDVLKMPHHGRWKDNMEALLAAVQPKIALICDSAKNPAEDETLDALMAHGIETFTTRGGDILVVSAPSGLKGYQ